MDKETVVMDTNFLLLPHQFRANVIVQLRDLLDNYSIIISTATIKELVEIAKKRGKAGMAAKFAIKLIEANDKLFEIKETTLRADDFIYEFAREHRIVVCTNDITLRKRVKKLGAKVIGLRSKARIGIV